MEFKGKITGAEEVKKVMRNMPKASQRKIYRQALRDGARLVQASARNNLQNVSSSFTGLSKKAGTIRIYSLKNFKGAFRVAVMVKRGLVNAEVKDKSGEPVRVGMYLAVLEYGSQKLNRRPRPWIRPAINENRSQAVSLVARGVDSRLNDALKDAKK